MIPILDTFKTASAFRPKTVADLFALRLACRLDDGAAANHYSGLLARHSESQLLTALRRTLRVPKAGNLGKRFHINLEKVHSDVSNGGGAQLIAIRVERRAIAAAIFHGEKLEYCQVRQLPSDKTKTEGSAIRFMTWMALQFPLDSAAIESIPNGNEIQRQVVTEMVVRVLRARLLPIWDISKLDLFRAYGFPPLKSRKDLREVITGIWPILAGTGCKTFIQDAVALGLYVQIERLFLN